MEDPRNYVFIDRGRRMVSQEPAVMCVMFVFQHARLRHGTLMHLVLAGSALISGRLEAGWTGGQTHFAAGPRRGDCR